MKLAIAGKGGSGKSTIAAALTLSQTRAGRRVLAVENTTRTFDYQKVFNARILSEGRYQFVEFAQPLAEVYGTALEKAENVLPTFIDPQGRYAAATGGRSKEAPR